MGISTSSLLSRRGTPSGRFDGGGAGASSPPLSVPGVVPAPLGVDLNTFEFLPYEVFGMMAIGKGGFGLVSVMRKVHQPDELFAVKVMSKHKLLQREMAENTLNELAILSGLGRHHGNVCNAHYAFQDSASLYIVLDLCLGGSVAHALAQQQTEGRFPLSRAKHYLCELIVALRYLHVEERIVHRDIKPDNVLIDAQGRIRITDFNVSFKVPVEGEHELVHRDGWGTRGYRAPEIYLRQGGGGMLFACDWWSLGAMFYEMLAGQVPFVVAPLPEGGAEAMPDPNDSPLVRMLRQVQAKEFDADKLGAEEDLRDFVRGLLEYEPAKRLGDGDVMAHPFLRSIDFARLERGEIRPPWVPVDEAAAAQQQQGGGGGGGQLSALSSRAAPASAAPLRLALFAKNFDIKVDERERIRALNSNLMAAGMFDGGGDGDGDEDNPYDDEVVIADKDQPLFASWSFNVHAPAAAATGAAGKRAAYEDHHLPLYGLLQSVSALQSPQAARDFIQQVDDHTLLLLLGEMQRVHEDLLLENAKFIQAEMRCDEMSRELARLKQQQQQQENTPSKQYAVKPRFNSLEDVEDLADKLAVGKVEVGDAAAAAATVASIEAVMAEDEEEKLVAVEVEEETVEKPVAVEAEKPVAAVEEEIVEKSVAVEEIAEKSVAVDEEEKPVAVEDKPVVVEEKPTAAAVDEEEKTPVVAQETPVAVEEERTAAVVIEEEEKPVSVEEEPTADEAEEQKPVTEEASVAVTAAAVVAVEEQEDETPVAATAAGVAEEKPVVTVAVEAVAVEEEEKPAAAVVEAQSLEAVPAAEDYVNVETTHAESSPPVLVEEEEELPVSRDNSAPHFAEEDEDEPQPLETKPAAAAADSTKAKKKKRRQRDSSTFEASV